MREALKLALEALEVATTPFARDRQEVLRAQAALRQALAQPEQEPFCYVNVNAQGDVTRTVKRKDSWCKTPLYTTPPQRKPLTVDDVWQNDQLMSLNAQLGCGMDLLMEVVEAIEAAHGIKE